MRKEKITEGLLNQVEEIRLFLKAVRNLSGLEHRIIVNKAVIEASLTAPRSDCIETKSGKHPTFLSLLQQNKQHCISGVLCSDFHCGHGVQLKFRIRGQVN